MKNIYKIQKKNELELEEAILKICDFKNDIELKKLLSSDLV